MTASRPAKTRSKGVPQWAAGERCRTPGPTGSRLEVGLSVARPLATLQLWSRIVTSQVKLVWQPMPTARPRQADFMLDLSGAGTAEIRPLEPGVPYPWPWGRAKQHITETVLEVELVR